MVDVLGIVPAVSVDAPICEVTDSHFYDDCDGRPRPVGVSIAVIQLSDVNLNNNSFNCGFTVYLDWPATREECDRFWKPEDFVSGGEGREPEATCDIADESLLEFRPHRCVNIKNAINWEFTADWSTPTLVWVRAKEQYFIMTAGKYRATFLEPYDLARFPLDVQTLNIRLQLGSGFKSTFWAQLCPISTRSTQLLVHRKYSVLEGYTLQTAHFHLENTDCKDSTSGMSYSQAFVNMKIQRRWHPYFMRLVSFLSLISFGTLAVFYYDESEVSDRVQHVFLLCLLGVVLLTLHQKSWTAIPNMTYLDHYIKLEFVFMAAVAFVVCITADDADIQDGLCTALLIIWCGLHCFFAAVSFYGRWSENQKLVRTYLMYARVRREESMRSKQAEVTYGKSYPSACKVATPGSDEKDTSTAIE